MIEVLNRGPWDLRERNYPTEWKNTAFALAIHEAAHATVSAALGYRVMGIELGKDGDEGICYCDDALAPLDDKLLILSAGAAAWAFIDPALKPRSAGGDLWWLSEQDRTDIDALQPGITGFELDTLRARAHIILCRHMTTLDTLADAVLASCGRLDERAISEITGAPMPAAAASRSTPVTTPSSRTFDRAKVRALLVSKGMATGQLEPTLNALEAEARDRGMTIVNGARSQTPMAYQHRQHRERIPAMGMRYGDPVGI